MPVVDTPVVDTPFNTVTNTCGSACLDGACLEEHLRILTPATRPQILSTMPDLRILLYSGDADATVPALGTRYWLRQLGLRQKGPTDWRTWSSSTGQVCLEMCDVLHQLVCKWTDVRGLTDLCVDVLELDRKGKDWQAYAAQPTYWADVCGALVRHIGLKGL